MLTVFKINSNNIQQENLLKILSFFPPQINQYPNFPLYYTESINSPPAFTKRNLQFVLLPWRNLPDWRQNGIELILGQGHCPIFIVVLSLLAPDDFFSVLLNEVFDGLFRLLWFLLLIVRKRFEDVVHFWFYSVIVPGMVAQFKWLFPRFIVNL